MGREVLITGSRGFVGSNLRKALPNCDTLDREPISNDELARRLAGKKKIVHLAGVNAGSGYTPPVDALIRDNILFTQKLVEAIRLNGGPPPLLVFLSSIHVYGTGSETISEDTPTTPTSAYGVVKLSQEMILSEAAAAGIIRAVILRASHLYGPGSRPNYNSAVATFCHQAIRGETIRLVSLGRAGVDLVYVVDLINYVARILEKDNSTPLEIINLSTGKNIPLFEIAETIEMALKRPLKIELVPGQAKNTRFPNQKLINTYGETVWTSLHEGVSRQIEAHQNLFFEPTQSGETRSTQILGYTHG